MSQEISVTMPDGRTLQARVDGPNTGPVAVFHHGTPAAPVPFGPVADAAEATGIRVVSYARPGYAGSTESPKRTVVDAAADTVAVLDVLGVADFVSVGASGGGPHALACAARHPDRCRAAATIAGVAPYDADGLDWLAGMGPENVEEFGYAVGGGEAFTGYLEEVRLHLAGVTATEIVEALGGLLPPVDRAVLNGAVGEYLAAGFERALRDGVAGWRDDDLAFLRPWGFDLDAISVPVAVWQGGVDLMVPASHGAWLAAAIPIARPHLLAGHGHVSLVVASLPEILTDVCGLG